MQPYIFREEEKPRFNITYAGPLAMIVLLLLLTLVHEHNPFRLEAAELARLQALKEEQEREMVFRFSDAPDEDIDNKDAEFLSDANRQMRSQQEEAPNDDPDPFSKGDTYELTNQQRQAPAEVQQPSPAVNQPEVQPMDGEPVKPQEEVAQTPTEPPKEQETAEEEMEEALPDEPEKPVEEVAEANPDPLDTVDQGTVPVMPGGPKPYRPLSKNELKEARQEAMREMNLRDAARVVPGGANETSTYDNPTGSNAPALGLTVETTRSDIGDYLNILRQLIKGNWRIPNIARFEVSGMTGISFHIHKDGRFSDVFILTKSGYEPLDVSALNAINNTNPAPPLPAHVDDEFVPIKFGFYYNMRPRYR